MIFCKACNNELWWEEDETADGKIYYVVSCSDCDSELTTLKLVVSKHYKALESASVVLSSNVLANNMGERERKIASQSLKALHQIGLALKECGVLE